MIWQTQYLQSQLRKQLSSIDAAMQVSIIDVAAPAASASGSRQRPAPADTATAHRAWARWVRREAAEPVIVRHRPLGRRRREAFDVLERGNGLAAEGMASERLAERAANELALQQEVEWPRHV